MEKLQVKGHIYVFTDPGVPDEFKIGHSIREVELRRTELSKETSRPRSLVELYRRETLLDSKKTESNVHTALKRMGWWIENSDKRDNEWFTGDFEAIVGVVDSVINLSNATASILNDPTQDRIIFNELKLAAHLSEDHPEVCLRLCLRAYNDEALIIDQNWAIQQAKFQSEKAKPFGEYFWFLADHAKNAYDDFDRYMEYMRRAVQCNWISHEAKQKCIEKLIKIYSSQTHEDFEGLMGLLRKSGNVDHKVQWAYSTANGIKFLLKSDPPAALEFISRTVNSAYADVLKFILTPNANIQHDCGIDFKKYRFDGSPPSLDFWDLSESDQDKANGLGRCVTSSILRHVFFDESCEVVQDPSVDNVEAFYLAGRVLLRHELQFYLQTGDLKILHLTYDPVMAVKLMEIAAGKGHRRAADTLSYLYANGPDSIRCEEKARSIREVVARSIDDTHLPYPCFGLTLLA
jgi:hypothetical protein